MSLQWADFPSGEQGLYGSNQAFMLNGTPWVNLAGTNILDDPDPAIGSAGKVFRHLSDVGSCPRMVLTDPNTVVGFAHRLYALSLPAQTQAFLSFNTTGNFVLYSIRLRPNGGIEIATGETSTSSGTVVAQADFPIVFANSWNHIETLINNATGKIEIRRNGVPVLTYTDPAPFGSNIGIIGFPNQTFRGGLGFEGRSKDMVLYNGQGSAFNTFQGSVLVTDLRPVSDVTLGGWTTSSGTAGWSLLDETPPNDADYIQAEDVPLPAPAELAFSNLPPDITTVRGLISITRSVKTDGGDGNLQTSLSPNGVNYDLGANNPVTTTPTYRFDVSQLSPATAAAWTPAEVDSIQQRYNRTV